MSPDAEATGPRPPYGGGTYRRRIVLTGGAGRVVADLEDDFHRFRVVIEHDGRAVRGIRGEADRFPWTSCPGALQPLEAFVGAPLSRRLTEASGGVEPRVNCTHLFDLATLAVAHAAAGRERRRYDVAVADRVDDRARARLARDGTPRLDWQVHGWAIAGPPPFAGRSLRGRAFLEWAESALDADSAEAAIVLRRAVFIAHGRMNDLDRFETAAGLLQWAGNTCHSFTEGIAERGLRVRRSTRDFSKRPEALLADLDSRRGTGS